MSSESLICFSETIANQGVIKNATIVDTVTVSGTLSAIGAMYGPIIPVMNANGRKLTMIAFSASGEQKQGTQWYDSELDIVVKQEYQNDVVDELRNINVGKVSKKLFIVPKDYVLFDTTVQATPQVEVDTQQVEVGTQIDKD